MAGLLSLTTGVGSTGAKISGIAAALKTNSVTGSLLGQILQGVQAGSLVISSYYQGQGMINSAKAEAEAAKYPAATPNYAAVTGGATASGDPNTLMMMALLGVGLIVLINKKK